MGRHDHAERGAVSGRIFTRTRVGWLLLGLVTLGLGLLGYAFLVGPRRLVVHREDLALPRWPARLAGLKVALVSDLHVGSPHWTLARAGELVARVNAEQPDLVLLAGDYVITGVVGGDPIDAEPSAITTGGTTASASRARSVPRASPCSRTTCASWRSAGSGCASRASAIC